MFGLDVVCSYQIELVWNVTDAHHRKIKRELLISGRAVRRVLVLKASRARRMGEDLI